jgi:hypothetical protein
VFLGYGFFSFWLFILDLMEIWRWVFSVLDIHIGSWGRCWFQLGDLDVSEVSFCWISIGKPISEGKN